MKKFMKILRIGGAVLGWASMAMIPDGDGKTRLTPEEVAALARIVGDALGHDVEIVI